MSALDLARLCLRNLIIIRGDPVVQFHVACMFPSPARHTARQSVVHVWNETTQQQQLILQSVPEMPTSVHKNVPSHRHAV